MTKLERYEQLYGDILFPAEVGTAEWRERCHIKENPAGKWMYSYDGVRWKTVPMDTGKIAFSTALLRKIPNGVIVGVNNDVKNHPEQFSYSNDNGHTWHILCGEYSHTWIYHGQHDTTWFKKQI